MSSVCPKCQSPRLAVYHEPAGWKAAGVDPRLIYCTDCRAFFVDDAAPDGEYEVSADDELLIPGPPVKMRIDENSELYSTRVFHAAGLLVGLIALFWLFITGFGIFSILPAGGLPLSGSIVVGGAMTLIGALLVMLAISLLANRISLEYFPKTGKIVYRKGPFNWWSKRLSFNASEIAEIHAAVADAAEGDYLYTAIHFNNGRKERFLDFAQKDKVRMQFEVLLRIMSVRKPAEAPEA